LGYEAEDIYDDGDEGQHAAHEFDPQLQEHQREIQKLVDEAASAAIAKYRKEHPEAAALTVRANVAVRKPRPNGFHQVPVAMLRQMLQPGWLDKSQEYIREAVARQFPEYSISKNIWREPQKPWQLKKLRDTVQGNAMPPLHNAAVAQCKTLADFRMALRAAAAKHGQQTFRATITVGEDYVTINDLAVKIATSQSNGRSYRTIRPNVDKLLDTLMKNR